MTVTPRLVRARRTLLTAVVLAALGWGMAVGAGVLVVAVLTDAASNLSLHLRQFILAVSVVAGVTAGLLVLARNRAVLSLESVSLWLEERLPELRYSLVTLAGGRFPAAAAQLEGVVGDVSWSPVIRRALIRGVGLPLLAAVGLVGMLLLLPKSLVSRVGAPRIGDALEGRSPRGVPPDPLHPLIVTVTPPAYSHLPHRVLEDPESVRGLTGSAIRIEGRGNTTIPEAAIGARSLKVIPSKGRWSLSLTMPDSASALWLEAASRRRLLVLEPTPDSVPLVVLTAPARDGVVSGSPGRIALGAEVRDDFGVAEAWFEYIVSAGEGENFTFRSGVVGRRTLGGRTGGITAQLALDSLKLAPGNVVHLRAVARDGNAATGPGVGYSETRTLRVPRPGEADSIAIDAVAPAEGDSSLLSERMLILMTEALERERPRLRRDSFIEASRRIGADQAALRRRVSDIIFLRLGGKASGEESEDTAAAPLTPEAMLEAAQKATEVNGQSLDFSEDESPVVALNRPLLEAYNAMWDAGRSLEIGEPRQALPHMRAALEAIQRARQAERLYLRGRPTATVIDLARVRLTGKLSEVDPAPGETPPPAERTIEMMAVRFARAVESLPASRAIDSLSLLRIEALSLNPRFAGELDRAVSALRSGRDATESLILARRILAGPPTSSPGLPGWSMLP